MRGMVEEVLSDRPARQRSSGDSRGDQARSSEQSRATVDAAHVSDASPVENVAAGLPQETDHTADSEAEAFLPCDVLFLFALGIESGGLVDSLKGVETTRLAHGIERAGKLDGREVLSRIREFFSI